MAGSLHGSSPNNAASSSRAPSVARHDQHLGPALRSEPQHCDQVAHSTRVQATERFLTLIAAHSHLDRRAAQWRPAAAALCRTPGSVLRPVFPSASARSSVSARTSRPGRCGAARQHLTSKGSSCLGYPEPGSHPGAGRNADALPSPIDVGVNVASLNERQASPHGDQPAQGVKLPADLPGPHPDHVAFRVIPGVRHCAFPVVGNGDPIARPNGGLRPRKPHPATAAPDFLQAESCQHSRQSSNLVAPNRLRRGRLFGLKHWRNSRNGNLRQ